MLSIESILSLPNGRRILVGDRQGRISPRRFKGKKFQQMILSWYFECRLQSITGSFNFFFHRHERRKYEISCNSLLRIFSALTCPITEDLVSRASAHLQVLTFVLSTGGTVACAYVNLNRLPKTVNSS